MEADIPPILNLPDHSSEAATDAVSKRPLVSFLIVVHDAGTFLRPCVASVLGQTHTHIEVVLVDSASTDGAVEMVVTEFAGRYAMQVVRSETNLGPSGGAMLGLSHCRGEFVARIDADDMALPDRIERQVSYLQSHPEKDAVGGDVLLIDAAGNSFGIGLSLRSEFMRRNAAKWYIGCFHTTLLVRRSVLVERAYNPTLFASGDHELIEWIARDRRLGLIPQIVCLYRQHPASITNRLEALQRLSGDELRRRMSDAIRQPKKRAELLTADFNFLLSDERLQLSRSARNRWFEDACRAEGDWLGAAYFASINRRWLEFGVGLARAATRGTPRREIFALFVCRTLWSLRLRVTNAGAILIKPLIRAHANGPVEKSLRFANAVNGLRTSARIGGAVAAVTIVCYFGLKPSPSARDVPWLSQKTIHFVDHHNFLFNVAGFFVVTAMVQACLGGLTGDGSRACWRRSAWMAGLVVGIEIVQLFLPRRVFDLMDIAAGCLGVLLATWVFLPPRRSGRGAMPS